MWREGYGWGMMGDWGMGWMLFPGLFWILILALVIVGIVLLVRSMPGSSEATAVRPSQGLATLEERYARGEIKREEFLEKKRDLLDQ